MESWQDMKPTLQRRRAKIIIEWECCGNKWEQRDRFKPKNYGSLETWTCPDCGQVGTELERKNYNPRDR